ncbi:MAG TPA: F0F1 ATP synthase subunit epsilon [Burkholderiales bacterium]|nr:F0F1 ATP synthase subunit epsilon [Burkholderiales bacterium]
MKSFLLHLQGASGYQKIPDVTSFVGQDDSGSFGILPDHARMMTVLSYGLARFMKTNDNWTYLAIPSGLLYFVENELHIVTRRYFLDKDYGKISTTLLDRLLAEEEQLKVVKENILRLEQEMLRRLWQIERGR